MTEAESAKLDIRVSKVAGIRIELQRNNEVETSDRIFSSFGWRKACYYYPNLSPNEIASMAASTYEYAFLPEIPDT